MKVLLGFVCGVIVATAGWGWAECCGAFNVPFDTQLAIEQAQQDAAQQRLMDQRMREAYRDSRASLGLDSPSGIDRYLAESERRSAAALAESTRQSERRLLELRLLELEERVGRGR